jgi:hypothetical protein
MGSAQAGVIKDWISTYGSLMIFWVVQSLAELSRRPAPPSRTQPDARLTDRCLLLRERAIDDIVARFATQMTFSGSSAAIISERVRRELHLPPSD